MRTHAELKRISFAYIHVDCYRIMMTDPCGTVGAIHI